MEIRGNYIYDEYGSRQYEIRGSYIYDTYGNRMFEIRGNYIHDTYGNRLYEIRGEYLFDTYGNRLYEMRGDKIFDTYGNRLKKTDEDLRNNVMDDNEDDDYDRDEDDNDDYSNDDDENYDEEDDYMNDDDFWEKERVKKEKAAADKKAKLDNLIKIYSEIIEKNPGVARVFMARGGAYRDKKDYKKAFEDYNEAIRLDPYDDEGYALRGMIYTQIKEYEKATADFNEAIKLHPNCINAYRGRGVMHTAIGEHYKSISDYEEALKIDPNDNNSVYFLENARKFKAEAEQKLKERKRKKTANLGFVFQFGLMLAFLALFWGTNAVDKLYDIDDILTGVIIYCAISLVFGCISLIFRRKAEAYWGILCIALIFAMSSITFSIEWNGNGIIKTIILFLIMMVPAIVLIFRKSIGAKIFWGIVFLVLSFFVTGINQNMVMMYFLLQMILAIPGIVMVYIAEHKLR